MLERYLDLRYSGQSYELVIPFEYDIARAVERFHRTHEQRFGYNDPNEQVHVVSVRLKARGLTTQPVLETQEVTHGAKATHYSTQHTVFATASGYSTLDTPVYDRASLTPGAEIAGPAIITQYDTTTILPPGWYAQIDAVRNLIVELTEG